MKSHIPEYWLEKIRTLDPETVVIVKKFFSEPENLNLEPRTKANYTRVVYYLLKMTGKPLREIRLEDVKKYFAKRSEQIKPISLESEFILLRRFLRYIGIELNSKLKPSRKRKFVVDTSQFLTDSEFERLLSEFKHPRDKALVMLLRETGLRIGEALALDVRDVEITERYGRLHVRYSKTAERYVEFVKSIPYIRTWLSVHPDPRPDNPLFVKIKGKPTRLEYQAFWKLLKEALKRAKINKRVHPHLFRHQVATELLSTERLPEEAVRVYLGWTHGSRMVSRYSHVTSERANELVMRARYGIKTREKKEEPKGYKECPRCGRMIPIDAKYCSYCGLVLEREEFIREKELRERIDELIDLLRKNPQLLDQLRELARKRKS